MRNKKLVAVAMTSMMVCAMGTNVCAASQIENLQGTDSKEVKATYETQDKAETVYSVDIEMCIRDSDYQHKGSFI